MQRYNEHELKSKVDAARARIRTILDNTRSPQYPADVPHRYEDKYLLAELVSRISIAAVLQCLEVVGMSPADLDQMRTWAKTRSVTIRLSVEEECTFVREETRRVEAAEERVTETRGLLGGKTTKTEKIITNITEYFWSFGFKYRIVAFQGVATEEALPLHSRAGAAEIKTVTDATPRPRTVVRSPIDLNLTWFLEHIDDESRPLFTIDRAAELCHTPRRNEDVDSAIAAFEELYTWCSNVIAYFQKDLFPAQQEHGRDLSSINDSGVFMPVVALFEGNDDLSEGEGVVPVSYANAFLAEERRSLVEKCRALSTAFPRDASVITAVEASLLVTLMHARSVCQGFANAVAYIEGMLRKQLVDAIGKEITAADFSGYMEFHHKKLVKAEYAPRPFSYGVRRIDHDPEGVLSIETERGGGTTNAISTTVARSDAQGPMTFSIDASTRVSFLGERYLHAWISHQFSGEPAPALSLVARARQFSSYIVLVGRIASADTFEPRFGIIVQNKDLLKIPLMLEQIPTPKEFRDAIESLSPEQQRFARAFRGMQLESTLFGVCVIQIKPQLEKLLKLPPDSLTKEIKMTQELLSLFIEYQIPSDLLSYDGPEDATTEMKLERVREYVARMREMIDLSKKREIEEEREREALRLAELNRTPPPPMAFPQGGVSFGMAGDGEMTRSMDALASPPASFSTGSVRSAPPPPGSGGAPPPAPMARPAMAAQGHTRTAEVATQPQPIAPRPTHSHATPFAHGPTDGAEAIDYTRIPGELDKSFEALDEDSALRATIINPGDGWTRSAQKGLLSAPKLAHLSIANQKEEKNRAFDLLDALSKSGALSIDDASLHVVVAATHCFDQTLIETVIQENVNPIEKVERSLMIVGTTIHGKPAAELLAEDQRDRFFTTSPKLKGGSDDVT